MNKVFQRDYVSRDASLILIKLNDYFIYIYIYINRKNMGLDGNNNLDLGGENTHYFLTLCNEDKLGSLISGSV